jgi:putative hydrolase of the HAD superfamily
MKYQHLFFDLDLTLWDLDKNSSETLSELFIELGVKEKYNIDFPVFFETYKHHNEMLWDQYRKGIVEKEELRILRFQMTLRQFGIEDNVIATEMGHGYVARSPLKTNLVPFAKEVLGFLKQKYNLHIITNGFEEVQMVKLENSGIRQYFEQVITYESSGYKKPDKRIFHYSLYRAKAKSKKSIMIGDHLEIDILGAKNAGLDQIYFNPLKLAHKQHVTYEIDCLSKLMKIL